MNDAVSRHYGRNDLLDRIKSVLADRGVEWSEVKLADLEVFDAFHLRGKDASRELATLASFSHESQLLDIGCGIGGGCRLLAKTFGCQVTGVDLTETFVSVARELTRAVGLGPLARYVHADASDLPFENQTFDAVWTEHVQMNIADKERFYQEVQRVLRPDGKLLFHEIVSADDTPIAFPVPWADRKELSHLVTAETLRKTMLNAGLTIENIDSRRDASIEFLKAVVAHLERVDPQMRAAKSLIHADPLPPMKTLLHNFQQRRVDVYLGYATR